MRPTARIVITEVLRTHLDRILVEEVGEVEARARYARAGQLLERAGASPEALAAYCRAEEWASVRGLLGGYGERLADGAPAWVETLPPAIVRHDPWLALADARRARAEGRWGAALAAYARAETAFGTAPTALVCRRERSTLAAWLDPVAIQPAGWLGILRRGLVREPLAAAREIDGWPDAPASLARGLLELAAGEVADAHRRLAAVAATGSGSGVLDAIAWLAAAVAALLARDPTGPDLLASAVDRAEREGVPWLARVGRAAGRLAGGAQGDGLGLADAAFAEQDDPCRAIVALLEAWAPQPSADPDRAALDITEARVAAAERAASGFRRLGAGCRRPGTWSRRAGARRRRRRRRAGISARSGELRAGDGDAGPRLLAYAALAVAIQAEPTTTS